MRHQQDIRQTIGQRLVVTPQLRQAIEILQLGAIELAQYVQQQVIQNPLLEAVEEPEFADGSLDLEHPEAGPEQLEEWLNYFADSSDLGLAPRPPATQGLAMVEMVPAPAATLAEHLRLQLAMADVEHELSQVASEIIAALDDDGYLRLDLSELALRSRSNQDALADGLALVQAMDPSGVAARDLRECLLLQLRTIQPRPELACRLVQDHLSDIAAGASGRLAQATGADRQEIAQAIELVRGLEPRPGTAFGGAGAPRYIVPDVLIEQIGSEYIVALHDPAMPQLRINAYYHRLAMGGGPEEGQAAAAFLGQRLAAALWLMRCLEQRRNTLYRVVEAISRNQREFLSGGIRYLRPMTLKDVAAEIGVHESTVSRAVANKYVQTPQGAFELRSFFTSSVGSSLGREKVSSASVKSVLSQLIQAEDPRQPHSDQRLVELLQRRGAELARRTVTKYRRELGMPSSAQRRRP